MRCKKHRADQSSSVGVCASCLRERLLAIIAAQALEQALQDSRKSDAHLQFPRSVSPHARHHLFYTTPQLAPNCSIALDINTSWKTRFSSLFRGIFRSKKHAATVPHPAPSIRSCSASPAWFPNIISARRKKKVSTFSIEESVIRISRNRGRGLSPEGGSSGYSSDSQGWRQTSRRGGGRGAAHSNSLSSLTFCLSPLVRPSPNRQTPEAVEPRKPQLFTAASFCKNRSRKLVDLGRYPTY